MFCSSFCFFFFVFSVSFLSFSSRASIALLLVNLMDKDWDREGCFMFSYSIGSVFDGFIWAIHALVLSMEDTAACTTSQYSCDSTPGVSATTAFTCRHIGRLADRCIVLCLVGPTRQCAHIAQVPVVVVRLQIHHALLHQPLQRVPLHVLLHHLIVLRKILCHQV